MDVLNQYHKALERRRHEVIITLNGEESHKTYQDSPIQADMEAGKTPNSTLMWL